MDMQMPEIDGVTATKIIRKELRNDTPIIALTAAVMQEDRIKCEEAGMTGFLVKPVDIMQLEKVISQYGKNKTNKMQEKL